MKKLKLVIGTLLMATSLVACGGKNEEGNANDTKKEVVADVSEGNNEKSEISDVDKMIEELKTKSAESADKFEYTKKEDGIVINKYKGSEEFIVIPEQIEGSPVVGIGGYSGLSNLKGIRMPGTIKTITTNTFNGGNLKVVVFDEGVELLEDQAFSSCDNLEKVVCPNSLKRVEGSVFSLCSNLKEVNFSENLKDFEGSIIFLGKGNITVKVSSNKELVKHLKWMSEATDGESYPYLTIIEE